MIVSNSCKFLCFLLATLSISSLRPLPSKSASILRIANHPKNSISKYHVHQSYRETSSLNAISSAGLLSSEWQLWSVLSLMSTVGIVSEKTYIGSMLSSPIVTMVATLILANIGLIPSSSPVYDVVMKKFVPLAIPLLLLDADLRKCIKVTGRLLRAFLVGAVGTVVGTLVAFLLVPMKNIAGGDKIASALCARHIGGAVNFVAVADILKISPDVVAAALAADNIVVAIYFTFLFAVTVPDRVDSIIQKNKKKLTPQQGFVLEIPFSSSSSSTASLTQAAVCPMNFNLTSTSTSTFTPVSETVADTSGCPVGMTGGFNIAPPSIVTPSAELVENTRISSAVVSIPDTPDSSSQGAGNEVTLPTLSTAISIGLVLYSIAEVITRMTGLSSLVAVSLLTVLTATAFPQSTGSVSRAGGAVGVLIMQMFFAVTGASGHISAVLRFGPGVFMHTSVQVIVHFIVAVGLGRLLKLPFKEIALASNANVGGPTTAAAMATSKRWNALILPALLTGVFGYAIATAVGVAIMRPLGFISKLYS